jgi:RNA polymerase sigma-70 factor (ECF subfamily)
VARLLSAGLATVRVRMTTELVQVNGWPALLLRLDGEVDGVVSVRVEDGLVSGIYTVRNPEKLSQVLRETAAGR